MKRNQWKQENIRLGTHGEDYGSWMSNPVFYIIGGIMEQVHRVVLSHLDYDGEGKILEVGCGSGALTIRSALTWPKAKVIGVDHWGAVYNYSKALCEKNAASEGVASRCVFQHGDAKQLDFPDESFDVVISNYVYHNVMGADMQKLLLESLRKHQVEMYTESTVSELNVRQAVIEQNGQKLFLEALDTVVIAAGYRSNPKMADNLFVSGCRIHLLGDADKVKDGYRNIQEGFELGISL